MSNVVFSKPNFKCQPRLLLIQRERERERGVDSQCFKVAQNTIYNNNNNNVDDGKSLTEGEKKI